LLHLAIIGKARRWRDELAQFGRTPILVYIARQTNIVRSTAPGAVLLLENCDDPQKAWLDI
jgi:hypothetical protein